MQILTEYLQVFENTYQSLKEYNDNLRNELFEVEPNEDQNNAYKRGERIFDQYEDDLKNITELIKKEKEVNDFFMKCKENKQKIIDKMNLTIDKLIRIKKNNCKSKEEYINYREEWNNRRIETPDQKNRRECEEMLEEIKEEKKIVTEMKQKMKEEEREEERIINEMKQQMILR